MTNRNQTNRSQTAETWRDIVNQNMYAEIAKIKKVSYLTTEQKRLVNELFYNVGSTDYRVIANRI